MEFSRLWCVGGGHNDAGADAKFAEISSDFICIYEKIAGGRGSVLNPTVTTVCLCILTSLAYDRVGPG